MPEINGIIFKNEDGTYELRTEFGLAKEENLTILGILQKHTNEGCSVRGTLKEIKEEM